MSAQQQQSTNVSTLPALRERMSLAPTTISEALEFSRMLAASSMVPKDYAGKPENVFVAIQMGMELGVAPMQALQNIAVINGRPAVWGDLALAICKAHSAWKGIVEKCDDKGAICIVSRHGEPDVTQQFTQADAAKAGLWGKQGPWTQYPRRMMQMRARAFALRDQFPDALKGIGIAEEVSDYPPEKDITPPSESRSSTSKLRGALGIADKTTGEVAPLARVQQLFDEAQDVAGLNAAVEAAKSLTAEHEKIAANAAYKAAKARLTLASSAGADEASTASGSPAPASGNQGGPSDAEIGDRIVRATDVEQLGEALALLGNRTDASAKDLRQEADAKRAELLK